MKNPEDLEISFGDTAIFACHAEGDPPLSIIWMHDDKELPLNVNEKYSLMDDGSLMIKNTQESDGGSYECMVKNEDTIVKSRTARMLVIHAEAFEDNDINGASFYFNNNKTLMNYFVLGKPRFIVAPQTVTTSEGAPEVRLPCQASGNPKPIIVWSKNGINISPSNRHITELDGTLIIRPVHGSDFGTYRCDATNQFGKVSANADIIINGTARVLWNSIKLIPNSFQLRQFLRYILQA